MSGAAPTGQWGDLRTRVASAAVLVAVGIGTLWAGGWWFAGLIVLAATLMVWELTAMSAPRDRAEAWTLAGLAGAALWVTLAAPQPGAALALAAPGIAALVLMRNDWLILALYSSAIMLACYGLAIWRADHGAVFVLWLIAVVIASDVGGYFAGRMLGGPKFWPRISPKKTWSGTVAGWFGAALVGLVFWALAGAEAQIIWLSALVALAAQMGDIAESAIKRRAGVKDASNLIPGHGGFLDRFDALLGAALFVMALSLGGALPVIGG